MQDILQKLQKNSFCLKRPKNVYTHLLAYFHKQQIHSEMHIHKKSTYLLKIINT